jgi:hypothetical protein
MRKCPLCRKPKRDGEFVGRWCSHCNQAQGDLTADLGPNVSPTDGGGEDEPR